MPEPVQGWGLGSGESAVLAVAAQMPGGWAVLDDLGFSMNKVDVPALVQTVLAIG